MNEWQKFIKAGLSSNIALLITYPIDIYKINKQILVRHNKPSFANYYRGIGVAVPFTFIDKGVKIYSYENVKERFGNKKFSPEGALVAGFTQSIFSNPADVIKIRNQVNNHKIFLYRGLYITWIRDIPFNMVFFGLSDTFDNQYAKFAGSFIATTLVTPLDVVRTRYFENPNITIKQIVKNMKFQDYFKGIVPRVISTGIFYGITYNLYLYI